jgi:hypothetical protein
MHDLRRFLVDYDLAMLRTLARNRGAALTTNVQNEAVDRLAAALREPLSVRTALARLSPQARHALDALLAAGGRMRAPQFARDFGEVRPIGPGRLEREEPWHDPANPAEELWYAALIFRAFADDKGGPGEFVFVPDDLQPLLPPPQYEPAGFPIDIIPLPAGTPPLPADGGEGHGPLIRDLFAYLVYIQNHDVRPYADPQPGEGRLARRDRSALGRRLADTDEGRLALLRHLAVRLGFVIQEDGLLRLAAARVRPWLGSGRGPQLAALQEAWRDDPTWIDLYHVPGLACDQATPWLQRYDPVAARRALLALLARCPEDAWWSMDSFVGAVKQVHPDFQRPDGDYTSWYIRDLASGDYLSGFSSWDTVEGAFITYLLARPLHWLGMVDIAQGEGGLACRLTASASRFLGLAGGEPEAPPSPPVVIHPDMNIEVPHPANLYTCFQLERFADPVGIQASGDHGGESWRYRLSVGGLGRALGRGLRVEQVLAFLQQASDDRLPANVAGQLRLWAGRFGQVKLDEVALLTAQNERTLRELSVLPETRALIGRILSPTTALVRRADLPPLRKALRDLGFLPFEEDVGDQGERG